MAGQRQREGIGVGRPGEEAAHPVSPTGLAKAKQLANSVAEKKLHWNVEAANPVLPKSKLA